MGVFLILCIEVDEKNSLIFFFVITVKLECSMIMADIIDFPSVRHSDNISDVSPSVPVISSSSYHHNTRYQQV